MSYAKTEKKDPYTLVTERIIEALEAGIVPWHKPWKGYDNGGPMSLSTGKPYSGVNVWVLEATSMLRGYSSNYWTTFKQAKDRGGSVKKGEKGTAVVFWKFIEKKDAAGTVTDRIPLLRYFTVFNLDQCDGLVAPASEPMPERDPIESCEALARHYLGALGGPELKHGGNRACYSPALDYVQMPPLGAFDTSEHYYGTLFHELAHSTGHADRIGRKSLIHPAPFGSEDYSREELIAEMAAAYLCGAANIAVNVEHHASYIGSWIRNLQGDSKLVVQAAAAGQRAANYVLGTNKEEGSQEPSSGSWSTNKGRNHAEPGKYQDRVRRDDEQRTCLRRHGNRQASARHQPSYLVRLRGRRAAGSRDVGLAARTTVRAERPSRRQRRVSQRRRMDEPSAIQGLRTEEPLNAALGQPNKGRNHHGPHHPSGSREPRYEPKPAYGNRRKQIPLPGTEP